MCLAGMPGVWARLMRVRFNKFDFVVVCLDDICVFSRSNPDHIRHLCEVLQVLHQENLPSHRGKCSSGKDNVAHFRTLNFEERIECGSAKIDSNWVDHGTKHAEKTYELSVISGNYRRLSVTSHKWHYPLRSSLTKKCNASGHIIKTRRSED